jgi:hypothetical protein
MPRRLIQLPVVLLMWLAPAMAIGQTLLVTSDAECHVRTCSSCSNQAGRGGLDRRATAIAREREADRSLLLLDAGNWLIGADSLATGGSLMVAAYEQLKYDAVNLTPKDLFLGPQQTLELLKPAKFAVVSASLVDHHSGKPIAKPYVVVGKTAVIGLCELPPGQENLPHVQQQLAGLRIRPPAEALAEVLPDAKAKADRIVVLYHGPGKGLRALRERLADTGAVIAFAGVGRENVPDDPGKPMIASERQGQTLARARVKDDKLTVEQIALTRDVAGDPAMQVLVASFATARKATGSADSPPPPTPVVSLEAKTPDQRPLTTAPVATAAIPPAMPVTPPATQRAVSPPATAKPALPRVTAKQPHQPKGLAGVGLTEAQVNAAIERARDALWKDLAPRLPNQPDKFNERDGSDLLVALALVHAKAHLKYPEFDRELRSFLTSLDPGSRAIGTYQSAVVCMIIESLGDPVYLPKMRQLTRMLVEFQIPNGSWDYGQRAGPFDFLTDPGDQVPLTVEGGIPINATESVGRRMKRLSNWDPMPGGDYSTSQFALLALRSAARGHLTIDANTWERALANFRSRINKDGGWAYMPEHDNSYGSMTCAAICSIAICRYQLGKQDPADDADIEQGLAWLQERFTLTSNPSYGVHHFYYLYSIERLGQILETEFIGPHEWYPLGARYLVDSQLPDGNWKEVGEDVIRRSTSFGVLFLTRATPKLKLELKTGGAGTVKAISTTPPPNRLYLILDGSGSMLEELNGRTKFDIARSAIREIVAAMPDSTEIALRVYGHRKRALDEGASEDTALELQMGKLDRGLFDATLDGLRPRGKTPMALSLIQAKQDLAVLGGQPVTVVLLTDGGEDSVPRKDPVRAAALLAAIKGASFHIVGFDINQPDWSQQLRDMAARGKAHYWPATKADALVRELRQAILGVPGEFAVFDRSEKELWRGQFGESRSLPEGQYQFKTDFAGRPYASNFWVNTDATTGVLFDATRIPAGGAATQPADNPPGRPPTGAPKYCSSCGAQVTAGAKFCTDCGQKLSP